MSLELSRRSFIKCSAAAAVMVACSGMLAGCGEDPNKPVLKGTGSITLAQAKITVANNPAPAFSGKEFTATMTITAGRANTYSFKRENFYVGFYQKEGDKYNLLAETDTSYNLPIVAGELTKWKLNQGETVSGTISYTLPSGYDVNDVDRVEICFRPDTGYETIYATWQLDKESKHFTVPPIPPIPPTPEE